MPRTFEPATGLRAGAAWRRTCGIGPTTRRSTGSWISWSTARCPYLDELGRVSGTKVRVTHLVTKALALGIQRDARRRTASSPARRIALRQDVDIFVQVATEGGRDLSGTKLRGSTTCRSPRSRASSRTRAARVRRHMPIRASSAPRAWCRRLPNALLGLTVRAMEYLLYDLQLDLSRFGIESDQFGSAMVSNIGNFEGFGMSFALAPLVPISRCPIVVLIGEVQRKPVVEGDRIVRALGRDARLHLRSPHDRRRAGHRDRGGAAARGRGSGEGARPGPGPRRRPRPAPKRSERRRRLRPPADVAQLPAGVRRRRGGTSAARPGARRCRDRPA